MKGMVVFGIFFSNSELQGDGVLTLIYLSKEEAITKYNLI